MRRSGANRHERAVSEVRNQGVIGKLDRRNPKETTALATHKEIAGRCTIHYLHHLQRELFHAPPPVEKRVAHGGTRIYFWQDDRMSDGIMMPSQENLRALWRRAASIEGLVAVMLIFVLYMAFRPEKEFSIDAIDKLPGPIIPRQRNGPTVTRLTLTGEPGGDGLNTATAILPPEAAMNDNTQPPYMCYMGYHHSRLGMLWFSVGDAHMASENAPVCSLTQDHNNRWYATMTHIPLGWRAVWVIAY